MVLWIVLVAQTGHTIAPMALAWSHVGYRAAMRDSPLKHIWAPAVLVIGSALIGYIAGSYIPNLHFDPNRFAIAAGPTNLAEFRNPFMAMVALYAIWNAYHFGKQAFGVLSVYRRKRGGRGSRRIDLFYACTVIWAAMVMPFIPLIAQGAHNLTGWPAGPHPFLDWVKWVYLALALVLVGAMLAHEWLTTRSLPRAIFIATDGLALVLVFHGGLWGFALIGLNHWLVAIGLAAHIDATANNRSPWWFAGGVMAAGFVLFCLLFVNFVKAWEGNLTAAALTFTAGTVSARLGLGFVHFLYDRWVYKGTSPIWR